MRHEERYETDATPSRTVAARYRAAIRDDESDANLALVHYRGGREELDLGLEYSTSADPLDRETGADILAQLGWGDGTFLKETVAALLPMLEDTDEKVIAAAAIALGHRAAPKAIPALLALVGHDNAELRLGLVHGLSGHGHPDAIQAMMRLSTDDDRDVRNWATFCLGSQVDVDTPELRDALRRNLSDKDHEIRGEAIVGLAERGDDRISEILIQEWESSETISVLSLEAAQTAADARLLPYLEQLATELQVEDDRYFAGVLEDAIKACRGATDPGERG